MQPARHLNLGFPNYLCAWLVGILLLKVVIANFGVLFGLLFDGVETIGSFVIGQSLGRFIGSLIPMAVVLGLIWLAFRRILGPSSIPVRAVERLAAFALRQMPRVLFWVAGASAKAIVGRSRATKPPARGTKD